MVAGGSLSLDEIHSSFEVVLYRAGGLRKDLEGKIAESSEPKPTISSSATGTAEPDSRSSMVIYDFRSYRRNETHETVGIP